MLLIISNTMEILRFEKENYFTKKRAIAVEPGFKESLYNPNEIYALFPMDYYADILVTDKGINVIKTEAKQKSTITPFKITTMRVRGENSHIAAEYPFEEINKNRRVLSPTDPSRNVKSLITGHQIYYVAVDTEKKQIRKHSKALGWLFRGEKQLQTA
jgi:hypothetical protein